MVGIKHFEDHSTQQILDLLGSPWIIHEKVDGSSIIAGLDDQGYFYTTKKGSRNMYSVGDWPNECWASGFKTAHAVLERLVETLLVHQLIQPNQFMSFEMLDNQSPNVVNYNLLSFHGVLCLLNTSWTPQPDFSKLVKGFVAKLTVPITHSPDGKQQITSNHNLKWGIRETGRFNVFCDHHCDEVKHHLVKRLQLFYQKQSNIAGFSNREVLDANLSKTHPLTGSRKWSELKRQLSAERDQLKIQQAKLIHTQKENILHFVKFRGDGLPAVGIREGLVVDAQGTLFKIVNRPIFHHANMFSHWVKYALVGGRRPVRPCFLSRTAHWPIEQRLARLDVLLDRYLTHHGRLNRSFGGPVLSYSGNRHQRMLDLFADTRKRIEDGR